MTAMSGVGHHGQMRAAVVLTLLLTTTAANAHIALRSPAPRTTEQKGGPCGVAGSTRGSTTTTYRPGEVITVEWDETVDHPGHYRIAFDDDGDDIFVNPVSHTDSYPWVLADQIADQVGSMNHYSQQVTLPDMECTSCTLQLMQIMTTAEPYNSFYYQCADLTISASAPGDPNSPGGDASGGCSAGGAPGIGLALALLAVTARRRRVTAG